MFSWFLSDILRLSRDSRDGMHQPIAEYLYADFRLVYVHMYDINSASRKIFFIFRRDRRKAQLENLRPPTPPQKVIVTL